MYHVQVQYYVIQYKPRAATWDYKEISGAITNFYDIRGLRYYAWTVKHILGAVHEGPHLFYRLEHIRIESMKKNTSFTLRIFIQNLQCQLGTSTNLNTLKRLRTQQSMPTYVGAL